MNFSKIFYYIFIILISAVGLLLLVSIFPIPGNIKFMIIQSGSMKPDIKTGSIVMVRPVDDYQIGDIVSFRKYNTNETPITHRINDIKIVDSETFYVTKDDLNNRPDRKLISQKEIIGKVLISIPYLGYLVHFAKKPLGFAFVIIVPTGIIIFDHSRKIYYELKKRKTEKAE